MTTNIILWNTKYGEVSCCLKELLKKKNISKYQLSRISGIRYEVIERYYMNRVLRYDSNIVAKICYCLNCTIADFLVYKK